MRMAHQIKQVILVLDALTYSFVAQISNSTIEGIDSTWIWTVQGKAP